MGQHSDMEFAFIVVGGQIELSDIIFWNPLHPYCLPYAALGSVKHAAPLQRLFASGMVRSIAGIPDA